MGVEQKRKEASRDADAVGSELARFRF